MDFVSVVPCSHKKVILRIMTETQGVISHEIRGSSRACLVCGLVKPIDDFIHHGCENCEEYVKLQGSDQKRVLECTAPASDIKSFVGITSPQTSFLAKYLRISDKVPGLFYWGCHY